MGVLLLFLLSWSVLRLSQRRGRLARRDRLAPLETGVAGCPVAKERRRSRIAGLVPGHEFEGSMSARKKKRKVKERKKAALQRRRSERRQASPRRPEEGPVFVPTPPGEAKMSEVLWAFVEPYLGSTRNEQDLRKLLDLALIAWSIPLFPADHREDVVRDLLNKMPVEGRASMAAILAQMVLRKETVFGNNKRMIISYDLTFTPDGPHLSVASTMPLS
jgi:hypothetical protein